MNNVHSEKFVDEIKNAKNHLELERYNVGDEIVIDEFSGESITLRGCTFENDVKFKSVDLSCGIRLFGCTFRGNMEFNNITISKIDFERKDGDVNDSLLLSNCKIEGQLAIHNKSQIIRNIHIKDDSEINKLYLRKSRCIEGGIQISNTIINKVRSFSQCIFINDIRFDYCFFKGQIRFENNDTSDYSFMNSVFEKDVWIWAGIVKNGVTFNGGEFKDTFRIEAIETNEGSNLSIFDAKFHDTFTIDYEYYLEELKIHDGPRSIWIKDSNFTNGIRINGCKDKFSPFEKINKIQLDCSNKLIGDIEISNFSLNDCVIQGTLTNSTILINDITTKKLTISKFFNKSTIQFVNFYPFITQSSNVKNMLEINSSVLGQTHFNNSSLNFDVVKIVTSDLSGINTSNLTWFQDSKLFDYEPNDLSKHLITRIESGDFISVENVQMNFATTVKLKSRVNSSNLRNSLSSELTRQFCIYFSLISKRELYRQLKHAMDQQGNKIQSLEFMRYEMVYYLKELKRKSLFNQNRLIMELGRTNSHGMSWSKPFWILMGITLFFSCALILTSSHHLELSIASSWSDLKLSWNTIVRNFNYFPKLLNPTIRLSTIVDEEYANSTLVNFLFIMYKIIYAFFIFQIIVAFRKYIRK
jgi:hypothetical protein